MKLRIRSVETKETVKIELPDDCSLHQLKETISMKICSSSFMAASVRVSLNGRDELQTLISPSQDSLSYLGITSGDLIFYTVDPLVFSPQSESNVPKTLISEPSSVNISFLHVSPIQEPDNNDSHTAEASQHMIACDYADPESKESQISISESYASNENEYNCNQGNPMFDCKCFALPRVFGEILKGQLQSVLNCKLLASAVHGILLDSGFVVIDPLSGAKLEAFHFSNSQSSTLSCITVWYSIHDLLDAGSYPAGAAVVKYQTLGKFITVYGSLTGKASALHRICLDEDRFAPCLSSVLHTLANGGLFDSFSENEVLELLKVVKDGLVLPLMVDLCERASIIPPPCLKWLPTELKLKIIELLPGVDIAKFACVSSEFRCLSSNNDLWKMKFREEFGDGEMSEGTINWKNRFALCWGDRKRRKRQVDWMGRYACRYPRYNQGHSLFITPRVIGGAYDWQPGGGAVPVPFRLGGRSFPSISTRQSFNPRCNLGGFNG